jgi:hypothetical protein
MKTYALALLPLLALAVPAHANTKVISFVESEDGDSDPVYGLESGKVYSQNTDGAINRAVSGIGTNKLYAKGNGRTELNGGSAWMDSYTVGGTGTVNVSLSFTVDGRTNVGANNGSFSDTDYAPFDWTYRVVALKGDNWNLTGQSPTAVVPGYNLPIRYSGNNYSSMMLSRVAPADATVTNTYQPRFGGTTLWSVRNFDTMNASFAGGYQRVGQNVITTSVSNGRALRTLYTPTYTQTTDLNTGALIGQRVNYNSGTAGQMASQTYQNLLKNYPILAQAGLCVLDETSLCPTQQTFEPTTMTLNFDMQAGETFTLLSYLSFLNLRDGEFDFYNTAKLSGITLHGTNASLTSSSGALQTLPGGGYGYAPLAIQGVPEPASWALMIGGFGLVGGVSRRRQRQAANTASNAVAAPRVA